MGLLSALLSCCVYAHEFDQADRIGETVAVADLSTYMVRLPDGSEYGPGGLELIVQWAQQGRVPTDAQLVSTDGSEPPQPVMNVPRLANVLQAPPTVSTGVKRPEPPDGPMSGVIPYRNPAALFGYYLAVFSLIPVLGLLLGPAAVICGIFGFRAGLKTPSAKGKVHAWVAIIPGGLTTIGNWGFMILGFVAANAR
ncbi:MAG: hypothetical protein ACYTF4_19010 [Planctomycetota bacterium]|jgi:hypothetical protein